MSTYSKRIFRTSNTLALAAFFCSSTIANPPAQSTSNHDVASTRQSTPSKVAEHSGLMDQEIPADQRSLLLLAFEAASAYPSTPHLKTKCLRQEEVAAACIALHQPSLALEFAGQINDWRRGAVLADLAYYCAQNDREGEVEQLLAMAGKIAAEADDWRRDHIRTKMARVLVWQGQEARAAEYEAGAINAEIGRVETARAARTEADGFDARLVALQEFLASGDFDLMRAALDGSTVLLDRFYANDEHRHRLESVIRQYAENMPVLVRLELFLQVARIAIKHDDLTTARTFTEKARAFLFIHGWYAQDKVPYLGRVAAVEHLVGMKEEAERELNSAIALYTTQRDSIITTLRATALLPVAEAYHEMDREEAARSIYARALEEAAANPNARPRANDLVAACLSMAIKNVVPDEPLWNRLKEIRSGLDHPW